MKASEFKKQLVDARDRAIAAYPGDDEISRDGRLHRFIGALQFLKPDVAEAILEVLQGKPNTGGT